MSARLFFRRVSQLAWRLCWAIGLAGLCAQPLSAAPLLCDAAARAAAQETGVPLVLLELLTRVETGRGSTPDGPIDPWPWTLNIGGHGSWHDSAEAALATARQGIAAGLRDIDLGCFQINYRWHGDGFPSLEAMMDPQANALYAARFLRDLRDEFGDWRQAAGAFHSRTPEQADRYLARLDQLQATLARTTGAGRRALGQMGSPGALVMAARPPLIAGPGQPMGRAVRPLWSATAQPLWENR